MGLFDSFMNLMKKRSHVEYRVIKDVDNWDGSAKNYSSAERMAEASLINFNPIVKGEDTQTWIKSLVKLPVREEGDDGDVYVRQAIFAAAGGRGIGRVTRPEGVTEAQFDEIIKTAATEMIEVYDEMGATAPNSIVDLAELERKVDRAVPMYSVGERLQDAINLADLAEGTHSQLVDIYIDNNELFAIVIRDGDIYRLDIIVSNSDIFISDIKKLEFEEDTAEIGRSVVFRQADGSFRWLAIASTSALNRVGEIDSRELFDSFINYANATKDFPILNFYHQGKESRLGVADYLARDEHTYIASGVFDDNEFGRGAAIGMMANPDYWGNSIEFKPVSGEMLRLIERGVAVTIPVFTKGINTAISVLPEKDAAALFTSHEFGGKNKMREDIKVDVLRLFGGDEALADRFEDTIDGVNREVDQLIHRAKDNVETVVDETVVVEDDVIVEEVIEEVIEEVVEEVVEEVIEEVVEEDVATEFVLDDSVIPQIGNELVSNEDFIRSIHEVVVHQAAPTNDALERASNLIDALTLRIAELEKSMADRLAVLEADEEQRRQTWAEDAPVKKPSVVVSYRARSNGQVAEPETVGMTDKAKSTLRNIYGN